MKVFRLSKGSFRHDLSGKGAELAGGRWNNKGTAILYTAGSRSLCALEILVHLPIGLLPSDYHLVTIEFPDSLPITEITSAELPADWQSIPPGNATQRLGDLFVQEQKSLVLKVPSAVVKDEFNFLINPAHSDFSRVKILETELFEFDSRLFKIT